MPNLTHDLIPVSTVPATRSTSRRASATAGQPLPQPVGPWTHRGRSEPDPARALRFYLGAHRVHWLQVSPVPLCVSFRHLAGRRTMPPVHRPWVMDSGAFTELQLFGTWTRDPDEYGAAVTRLIDDAGHPPTWVAPQDHPCEPWVLHGGVHAGIRYAGTGLSIEDHQQLTVENYLYLSHEFPFIPWLPVLQGWTLRQYLSCVRLYEAAGVDLPRQPLVGLGSVCRRQATTEIGQIVSTLADAGLRLHGFGVKVSGLRRYGHRLASADSMAWSRQARLATTNTRGPWCTHRSARCNNCLPYAIAWRDRVLSSLRRPVQLELGLGWTA